MTKSNILNDNLKEVKTKVYDLYSFKISNLKNEPEGKAYDACKYDLNGMHIISRSSKITPKKLGQFVTFWKRSKEGITKPFDETDQFNYYIINVKLKGLLGQFVFPKSKLIKEGIVSNNKKGGKRGFRVYPKWVIAENKQAKRTQNWQLEYFYEINSTTDFKRVAELYNCK